MAKKTVIFSFFACKNHIFQDEVTKFGRILLLGCIGMASQLYKILGEISPNFIEFWNQKLVIFSSFSIRLHWEADFLYKVPYIWYNDGQQEYFV